jgi:hypothetical protein
MSRAEKNALIAERLEGWTRVAILRGIHGDLAQGWPPGRNAMQDVPNYSSDLNLCARVEAKIAEDAVMLVRYKTHLQSLTPPLDVFKYSSETWLMLAPATARVNAMVRLIQAMDTRNAA